MTVRQVGGDGARVGVVEDHQGATTSGDFTLPMG
jgi:hypothetical protein